MNLGGWDMFCFHPSKNRNRESKRTGIESKNRNWNQNRSNQNDAQP